MRKLCLLWLAAFLLWSCGDSESTTSATNVFDLENSHLTKSSSSEEESSSSEVQSSSSSESDEDESCSSSTEEKEDSSSSDQKSSSSSKKAKSGSSKSKSKSSSSSNSKTKLSSSSNSMTSSSSVEHCNSEQISSSLGPYVSPIRMQPLTAKPNANKSEFTFTGGAFLERPCIPEDTYREPYFTSVELVLAHVNEHGQNEVSPIKLQYTPPTLPATVINLAEMGVKISDSAKTQCGNFKLFVDFTATDDPNNPERFLGWDSVEFVREPIYCEAEPKSSSSAAIDSVVRKVEIRQFNGLMSTSETRGYSFKEDAEVPIERAQIQVKQGRDGGLMLYGVNGHKVTMYDNFRDRTTYSDDWYSGDLPPSPVHTTDFKFTEANLTDSTYFDVNAFWIVIGPAFNKETAEDFYTITLKTMERANENGVSPLKIIYYKK
jgi:Uncharacterized conserved protein